MEPFIITYSPKCIPIPTRKEYISQLVEKIEGLLRRVRWKMWHFLNPGQTESKETYGFPTTRQPAQILELREFEEEMTALVTRIKFKSSGVDEFQSLLTRDVRRIEECEKMILKADKTNNYYLSTVENYRKALQDNVKAEYRKIEAEEIGKVNVEAAKIAAKLQLDDRIDVFKQNEPFLTVKDHKPDFPNRISYRMVNPAKPNLGKIAKVVLDKINDEVRAKLEVNQWKNTREVLEWFRPSRRSTTKKRKKYHPIWLFSQSKPWWDYMQKLVESMPRRMQLVVDSEGSMTKYLLSLVSNIENFNVINDLYRQHV